MDVPSGESYGTDGTDEYAGTSDNDTIGSNANTSAEYMENMENNKNIQHNEKFVIDVILLIFIDYEAFIIFIIFHILHLFGASVNIRPYSIVIRNASIFIGTIRTVTLP